MAAHRQSKASASTATDQSLAFDADVVAGSLLVLVLRDGEYPVGTPTITDSQSNTWTLLDSGSRLFVYQALAGSSGPCTVNVDSPNTGSTRVVMSEFGGVWGAARVDRVATPVTSTASMTNTATAITPARARGVLLAIQGTGGSATAITVDAGYTIGPRAQSLSLFQIATAYHCFSAIASYAPTFSGTGSPASGVNVRHIAFVEDDLAALTVAAHPTTTASGYLIDPAPAVQVLDAAGALDGAFAGNVTAALVGSGVLLGTTTVAAVAGVATFPALRPCEVGSYQLRFSAAGFDDLDSAAFTVTSGAGSTVLLGDSMQSPPIPHNTGTAALRRILLDIRDAAGAAWAGSVAGVKAKLSKGGDAESDSPADIVRIAGSLHYVECAQPYIADTVGLAVAARVPAADGRLEARTVTSIIPGDSYATALQQDALVVALIRASVGLDGFGYEIDETNSRVRLTLPGVGVVDVDATYGARVLPLLALGAGA